MVEVRPKRVGGNAFIVESALVLEGARAAFAELRLILEGRGDADALTDRIPEIGSNGTCSRKRLRAVGVVAIRDDAARDGSR